MSPELPSLHTLFSNVWGIILMVLLLEGSIFVHELGHFLAARWRGLKVDRFSIGFGPKVFGWRGRDGVEYRLSLLPLGGYVALPQFGEIRALEGDSSDDIRNLPEIDYPSKMIVAVAGATFNVLFAFVLASILWVVGLPSSSSAESNVIGYVVEELPPNRPGAAPTPGPAFAAGLRPGDRILDVDGRSIRNFRDLQTSVTLGAGRAPDGRPLARVTYERAGQTQTIDVFPALRDTNLRSGDPVRQIGLHPAGKLLIAQVSENSPAARAGFAQGDEILKLNGIAVFSADQFIDEINRPGTTLANVTLNRAGQVKAISVTPVRVPRTTPLATLTINATDSKTPPAKLDILPVYPLNAKDNPALPTAPARGLLVWRTGGAPALFGGLRSGDFIQEVNGLKPDSIQSLVNAFSSTPPGQPIRLAYLNQHEGSTSSILLSPNFTAAVTPPRITTMLGLVFKDESITLHLTPFRQFSDALDQTFTMLGSLLNPKSDIGINLLSGPVGMGRALQKFSIDDVRIALWFTVLINISLAILNLMPLPVLDGGHMVLATLARLRGRALPLQFVVAAQSLFVVLLMSLMLYVIFNDSRRWLGDNDFERELKLQESYNLKVDYNDLANAAAAAPLPANAPAAIAPSQSP